jgi:probable phosphoglycerate mutase
MTDLALTRHGETDWNQVKRIQGSTDIALNAHGLEQARKLAQRLAAETVDVLVSSDLLRARQTAAAIADKTGRHIDLDPRLRERNYGVLEGLTAEEIRVRHPIAFEHWRARTPDFVFPNGESLRQFYERVQTALTDIARRYAGRRVVIVTHGGVLDCAYRLATGTPLDAPRIEALLNASLSRLRFDEKTGSFAVVAWGDVSHLTAPPRDQVGD